MKAVQMRRKCSKLSYADTELNPLETRLRDYDISAISSNMRHAPTATKGVVQ
jgi:hypothetical protein